MSNGNADTGVDLLFMVPKRYLPDVDPTGWWMTVRPPGVRVWWTGSEFLRPNGHRMAPPLEWVRHLPSLPLEGVLASCGRLDSAQKTCARRGHRGLDSMAFMVWDAPDVSGALEHRISRARRAVATSCAPFLGFLAHTLCSGREHLAQCSAEIRSSGATVLLRKPSSAYVRGAPSVGFLDVVPWVLVDAHVVGHRGRGRDRKRPADSVVCSLDDGTRVTVRKGFSEGQRHTPPPLGSRVRLGHFGLTPSGRLRDPFFAGVVLSLLEPSFPPR